MPISVYVNLLEEKLLLAQTGRILFSVHEDLNGYRTSALTASILEFEPVE